MNAVVASAEGRTHPALGSKYSDHHEDGTTNGTKEGKPNGTKKGDEGAGSNSDATPYDPVKFIEEVDVRIPETVVDEGVRGLKDILRDMVDLEDEGPNGDKK